VFLARLMPVVREAHSGSGGYGALHAEGMLRVFLSMRNKLWFSIISRVAEVELESFVGPRAKTSQCMQQLLCSGISVPQDF
jgi:hypothetical protein